MGPDSFLGGVRLKVALSMTAWKRPQYFEKVLDSIIKAGGAALPMHISIDGGYGEQQNVMREIVEHKSLNASVYAHEENLGCSANTHYALSKAFEDSSIDAIIHLEDDTMLHPNFFDFMLPALEHYKDQDMVFSISGYANRNLHPITEVWGSNNVGIRNRFTCWGWGITRNTWDEVSEDWFGINFTDYEKFVEDAAKGKNSFMSCISKDPKGSWAWPMNKHWRKDRLEIAPDESLVQNIGEEDGKFATSWSWQSQQTDLYFPNRIYESFDFEMADMELEELS